MMTASCQNIWNADQLPNTVPECSLILTGICSMEGPCEAEVSLKDSVAHCCFEKNEETVPIAITGGRGIKLSLVHDEDPLLKKRQKVSTLEEGSSISLKATESSIVEWLKNKDGVSKIERPKSLI